MKKWATIFCLGICFLGYSQSAKELYLQPGYASGASVSKVFESVDYIPLQTLKKSTFGRINKLIVTDKYFIVWDADTNSIYFFDKKGNFIKKYRPPKCIIKSIQLDKDQNAIFISGSHKKFNFSQTEVEKMMEDPTNKSFARFTWNGYYDLTDVKKEKVQELNGFSLSLVSPTIFNKNWWAYSYISANRKMNDASGYEVNVFDGEKTIYQYFPYSKKKDAIFFQSGQATFFTTAQKSELLFTRPYNYGIYLLTKDSISLLYSLIMPLDISLPKSFFTQSFRSKNDIEAYRTQNGGQVFGIQNVYKLNQYLFFSLDYKKGWRDKNFLYDESSGRFYNYNKINADSSNNYLPVMGFSIQYSDDTYIYSSTSASNMLQSKENNQQREPKYTPEIKQYLDNAKRSDNPVIIQLKLKNKIG